MSQIVLASEVDNKFSEFDTMFTKCEALGDEINIHLCSIGGDVGVGFAFVGRIRQSSVPVVITAFGHVCSIAVAIFLSGDERKMEKNSWLMLHETQVAIGDEIDASAVEAWSRQVKKFDEQYYDILAENSNKSKDYWKKRITGNPEVWLDAKECLKLGLCHEVI